MNVFERFTDRARRVLALAQEEARLLNHNFIGTEHILLGLIREREGLAAKALESLNISLEVVREQVEATIGPAGFAPTGSPPFTPRAKKVLELSLREALQLGHNYIGTEHMLLGLVREGHGVAAQLLESQGVDLMSLRMYIIEQLSGNRGREASPPEAARFAAGRGPEWLRHPTRVLSGSTSRLGSDGLEFRIVGALLFLEGTRVLWRMSGVPKAIADVMSDRAVFSPAAQRENSVAYVTISDNLNTVYEPAGSLVDLQANGEWAGTSFFIPAIPASAQQLDVHWQEEILTLDLGTAP